VRIVDLARKMIQLSGREPDRDVAIEIIGRRPGEKLHEELFNADEEPRSTGEDRILMAQRAPLDPAWVEEAFAQVEELVYAGDAQGLAAVVSMLAEGRRVPDTLEAGEGALPGAQ
jgi:FlaA1/EpsC-like NDP-sugar epimerase